MTLSQKEIFEQNLKLTQQRLLKEIESPENFEWVPQNARIINLPKDTPDLLKANLDLAIKLIQEQKESPVVLIPEPGFEIPWSELVPLVAGKRITHIESIQDGGGVDLIFDDGSQLMFIATRHPDVKGNERMVISIGMSMQIAA